MFGLGVKQHFAECVAVGTAGGDGRILAGLVDDQHIAGIGHGRGGIETAVFRQMIRLQGADPRLSAVQQDGIVQRIMRKYQVQIGRHGRVEMHAAPVDVQPDGQVTGPSGPDRA